jgi:hypothetical protein
VFFVTILVVTAVAATLFGVFSFYFKNKRTLDDLQALEMSDFATNESGELPSNIKVTNNFSSVGGGRRATSQGRSGGDDFMDHVRHGLSSLSGVLSSLAAAVSTPSSSSSSGGTFTALQSSSSHSTGGSSAPDDRNQNYDYDPPPSPPPPPPPDKQPACSDRWAAV